MIFEIFVKKTKIQRDIMVCTDNYDIYSTLPQYRRVRK